MKKSTQIIYPMLIAVAIVIGIYIGKYYDRMFTTPIIYSGQNKIEGLLNMIKRQYVDTVNIDSLIETAIPKIIGELDPHSTYISAADLQMVNDDLEGTFSGIGIEFSILEDTVTVVGVISGGPSEKVGIIPGDRIIAVNDTAFTGNGISNEKVLKRLRGPKGSEVKLTLSRISASEPIEMLVTRGDIPVNSVDAAFRTNDGIGYIKVSKFGRNTYTEFLNSLAKLRREGSDKFIIDLRGNTGAIGVEVCGQLRGHIARKCSARRGECRTFRRRTFGAAHRLNQPRGLFQYSQIRPQLRQRMIERIELQPGLHGGCRSGDIS